MSYPAFLQDSAAGLGASVAAAGRTAALGATEDNAGLHALLVSLGGPNPAPATPTIVGGPSAPASLPVTDATKNIPFYKKKGFIIAVVVIGAIVILGGGKLLHHK